MPDIAISLEDISKLYLLGHQAATPGRYMTFRDALSLNARSLARKTSHMISGQPIIHGDEIEQFWALKNISFKVDRGDRLGIIGRNGAGKSTLLKILSRITEPSTGQIKIRGRISSLLEVGTGFHPELSGRENIFLNGAILGMSRAEIQRKFAEIVDFAEVEKFLDTPVKRYSSGMYVRLAFAVAAHLEPEILVVDEVLAVGDAKFQEKCLTKMGEIANHGLTVLFVSHNMGAILNLCNKGLMLERGQIKYFGETSNAIAEYQGSIKTGSSVDLENFYIGRRGPQTFAKFTGMKIIDSSGNECDTLAMGEAITINLTIEVKKPIRQPRIGIMVRNSMNILIHDLTSAFDGFFINLQPGTHVLAITIPETRLYPGRYTLGPWIQQQVGIASDDFIEAALGIEIVDKQLMGHREAKFHLIKKEGAESYQPSQWSVI